jgi:hypothetical protein
MKKVNCSVWAVVSDGEICMGELDGVMIRDSKRDANALLKTIIDEEPAARVARVKCVEVVKK